MKHNMYKTTLWLRYAEMEFWNGCWQLRKWTFLLLFLLSFVFLNCVGVVEVISSIFVVVFLFHCYIWINLFIPFICKLATIQRIKDTNTNWCWPPFFFILFLYYCQKNNRIVVELFCVLAIVSFNCKTRPSCRIKCSIVRWQIPFFSLLCIEKKKKSWIWSPLFIDFSFHFSRFFGLPFRLFAVLPLTNALLFLFSTVVCLLFARTSRLSSAAPERIIRIPGQRRTDWWRHCQ